MPIFATPLNNAEANLTAAHVIADGLLTFSSTTMFGSPSAGAPILVTASNDSQIVIFKITGSTSTTLTIDSAVEGTSDIALPIGTKIEALFTAGHLSAAYTAINDLVIDVAAIPVAPASVEYASSGTIVNIGSAGITDIPLAVTAVGSQTGNLTEWRNSSDIAVSIVDPNGYAFIRTYTFVLPGTSSTGTNKTNQLTVERNGKIIKAFITSKTAPTGSAFIVDINKGGTSIWNSTQSNRVQLASGATTGTQTSFDTTSLTEGDLLTIDVDQIGSTVAGQDITVQLTCLLRNQ